MLFFRDWPLRLKLHPSSIAQRCFRVLAFASASLLLVCSWFFPLALLCFPLLYLHLKEIQQRYVSLSHPDSVIALECLDGIWKFFYQQDECHKEFQLEAYSFNVFFVSLLFSSSNRRFGLFPKRNRLLILNKYSSLSSETITFNCNIFFYPKYI